MTQVFLPLTNRQFEVLKYLNQYTEKYQFPPTIAEIQRAVQLDNPGLAFKALLGLENKGYITRIPGRHRNLRLTELGDRFISKFLTLR